MSYTPPVTEEQQDPNAREAEDVAPHEAALLAGMIASPSMYDPIQHPQAAKARRNLVLQHMLEMKAITQSQYDDAIRQTAVAVYGDDLLPGTQLLSALLAEGAFETRLLLVTDTDTITRLKVGDVRACLFDDADRALRKSLRVGGEGVQRDERVVKRGPQHRARLLL